MTEKEKAKAYDEAIERAKELYDNGITEEIFPELNEDERIKKDLIQWIDEFPDIIWRGHNKKDVIAWLEKQGKNSIDKIEPKFNVGDWVVNKFGDSYHIDSLDKKNYQISDGKGNYNYFPISQQDKMHLWTIQDAKDGNILACNEEILLFKSYSAQGRISLYCWYNGQTNNFHSKEVIDTLLTTTNKVCPATKEQCDLLFQKIKEAGYEWDADKKELKKSVEPKFKVGDWIISSVLGTARIIGVNDSNEFQLEYIDGKQKFSSIDYVNYAYDKWTINNVKDGDVLFTSSSACSDTFVFKSIDEKGNAECYFAYDSEDGFTEGKYHFIGSASDCKPATKAQCDFLIKVMTNAGYEWDAEKKELKKLDLVPNKKPILGGLKMKTYNDINIGDTVYIWGTSDSSIDETTITEKYDDRGHWNLKFSNGCVGRALKNGTSSTMGMYNCLVYSDKEAVRESINERIKILSNIKI